MPSRTLLAFFGHVGDLVQLTPALRALADGGTIDLLARPWSAPLLAHEPWAGRVWTLRKPYISPLQDLLIGAPRRRLGQELAAVGYQRILAFDGERSEITGWIDGWRGSSPFTRLAPAPPEIRAGHAVEDNRAVFAAIGADAGDAQPSLTIPPAVRAAAAARLAPMGRRVVALQAGSSMTNRLWRKQRNVKGLDPGQWARLVDGILARGEADGVILLGTPLEQREALAIRGMVDPARRDRVHDLTRDVGLDLLPGLLSACTACLSIDTGPAHIAAAVGTPLLVVFGPVNPVRFRPRGSGPLEVLVGSAPCQFCHGTARFRTCQQNICLTGISDATLCAAWQRLHAQSPLEIPA